MGVSRAKSDAGDNVQGREHAGLLEGAPVALLGSDAAGRLGLAARLRFGVLGHFGMNVWDEGGKGSRFKVVVVVVGGLRGEGCAAAPPPHLTSPPRVIMRRQCHELQAIGHGTRP